MEERSYNYSDDKAPEPKKRPLWIIILTMIVIAVLLPVLIFTSPFIFPELPFGLPFDTVFLSMIIFVPMLLLILICACGCNQPISPEEKIQDAKIFESMRHHAAPAEHVEGLDRYRCSECEMSFELHNAEPVDENIVLCPLCGTRLYLG